MDDLLELFPELRDCDGTVALRAGVMEGAKNIDTGEPVAPYAAANEFGTSRIPSRPFPLLFTKAQPAGKVP